jgi:hypothetical protein
VKEYILAVGKILWMLLIASALTIVLALPRESDRSLVLALQELNRFQASFKQRELEKYLFETASYHFRLPLQNVTKVIKGPNAPIVTAAKEADPLMPLVKINLTTLGAIYAVGRPDASVLVGMANPKELAASIEWRLVQRKEQDQKYQLESVALTETGANAAALSLERQVVEARTAAIKAKKNSNTASDKADKASETFERWRKWKAPWKVLQKALDARKKAQAEAEETALQSEQAQLHYDRLAERGQKTNDVSTASKAMQPIDTRSANSEATVATATLKLSKIPGGSSFQFRVPVAIESRMTRVPRLLGCDFSVTRTTNLWNEVSKQSVPAAIATIEGHTSWRYRHVRIGYVKLGGMTFFQIIPIAFLALLLLLLSDIRKARASYNPFGGKVDWTSLPKVGFDLAPINIAATVVLPAAACLACIGTLLWIDELPAIPILSLVGGIVLGVYAYINLEGLRNLRDEVTRSHSTNPPDTPGQPMDSL